MQYKGVWTNKGLEKLAAFASGGKAVSFAQVAIGDGGGAIPEPSAAVTALAGEVWRGAINTVSQNAENTSSVLVEIVIPYNVGGFFIREWGIYDDEGDLLVYGNHAEFYKALLAEGTGTELRELIELPITNEGAVQITVSYESLASVDFVKSQIQVVLQKLGDHEKDPKAHEEAIAEAVKKAAGLPLGYYFLHPHEKIPEYAIVVNGGTYSRTLYKDLWAYAQKHGWVKTEAEWQRIASENNGFCPYWSDGDGETTFRVPKFAPYQKLALTAGTYFEAGLPNIEGNFRSRPLGTDDIIDGCFVKDTSIKVEIQGGHSIDARNYSLLGFNASGFNSIYGKSDSVQPESHAWILCIVALNEATNIGEADIADVMAAIAKVQNDHNALEGKLTDSYISGLGMPSNEYINVDVTQSGMKYSVPFNGYLTFFASAKAVGAYIGLTCSDNGMVQGVNTYSSSGNLSVTLPVRKGSTVTVGYADISVTYLRMVKLAGEI